MSKITTTSIIKIDSADDNASCTQFVDVLQSFSHTYKTLGQ